jgi:hypothetical protein
MRAVRPWICLALAVSVAACGSDGASTGPGGRTVDVPANAPAAKGNVMVTIRTWNRNPNAGNPPPTDAALVNASSEVGQRLTSGRASSTVVRTLEDEEMGKLLAMLEAEGFYGAAKEGMSLRTLTDDGRRRGVIVVERDGRSVGLEYYPGSPGADVFRQCRDMIHQIHDRVGGWEARAATGPADERLIQAPKAPPLRRPQ